MKIQNISNVSFCSYIPVVYMAKNPDNNKFEPVISKENKKECTGHIVRNLKGIADNPNDEFIAEFKKIDSDYKNQPAVCSFHDKLLNFYLTTGKDAQMLMREGDNIWIAKKKSLAAVGTTTTFEVKYAKQLYKEKIQNHINNIFNPIRSNNGKKLTLVTYFEPQYKNADEDQKYEFIGYEFKEDEQSHQKE